MAKRPNKATEEPVAAEMTEDVKAPEKKKTTTRRTSTKKTEAAKDEAVKAETSEAAPKKTTAKKPATKKVNEPEMTMTIQFQGKDIVAKDVMEAAKKAYLEANPEGEIKSIAIYVKPEENAAYYVVNGEGSEDYKIQL